MRVHLCPSDRAAVGHYRIRQPVQALRDAGEHDVTCDIAPGLPMLINLTTGRAEKLHPDFNRDTVDVLVLQRPMAYWQALAAQQARERGIAVIVEIDDDFHSLHPSNPAWAQTHPNPAHRGRYAASAPDWNRLHLAEAIRHAHLITTTTRALAQRYAPNGNAIILPNYVDHAWTRITHPTDRLVVGWTGTVATHRDDLQATHGGVAAALTETGGRLRVIGHPQLVRENLHLDHDPEHIPWADITDYPHHIARLDLLIAPLADTMFNHAKSWLKPLEASALGVPVIMSPVADYQRLHHQHGIGIIANWRARDWRRQTRRILTDRALRDHTARHARETVRNHLTIQTNAWRWPEAWQHALNLAEHHKCAA